jgi:hypothetical protein
MQTGRYQEGNQMGDSSMQEILDENTVTFSNNYLISFKLLFICK